MPQSLVKIIVHIVFSTKNRADLITPDIENELYAYISGIISNNGSKLIIANGTANHSHLLASIGRNDIAALVGDTKRSSSLWIKKQGIDNFYWQKGYGAFSISESQVEVVSQYIRDQKKKHAERSFEDEFRALCRKYGVKIDERYCWD